MSFFDKIGDGLSSAVNSTIGAVESTYNTVSGGIVSGVNTVAGGIVSGANTVGNGVVNTANTVSHGVIGAANTVSDSAVTAWKATSNEAKVVGTAFEGAGLTMGQGMIDGANVAYGYGKIGVDQTYKGLVAAEKYITQHLCDIAIGSMLAAVFAALAADGEEEATFGSLAAACAAGTVSRAAIKTAADAIAVVIVEPIFNIPGVASAVGHKGTFEAVLSWVITKAASENPKLVVGTAGQFVAGLVIATVTSMVCEGTVPAGGPKLWSGVQGEQPDPVPAPKPRNFLRTGDFMLTGESIVSVNGKYFMTLQSDGNLCIYNGTPQARGPGVWCSGALAAGGVYAIMQNDGNLCVYQGTGPGDNKGGVWCSGSTGAGKIFYALMQDDGNVSVNHGLSPAIDGGAIWGMPHLTKVPNYISTNCYLKTGGYITSPSRNCFMTMQSDGNLCIYHGSGPANQGDCIWSIRQQGPGGAFFLMLQEDGHLCVYKGTGPGDNKGCEWCSTGVGTGGVFFAMLQDDFNLAIYKGTGPANNKGGVWRSGTGNSGETIYPFIPGSGSVSATHEVVPTITRTGMITIPVAPNYINTNGYLKTGGYITSASKNCFMIMQGDGNLCIYHGSSPANKGDCIWSIQHQGSGGAFFLLLQEDGHLCVYKGAGPNDNQGGVWSSGGLAAGNVFYAILQDDFNIVVYKGTGPADNRGGVWGRI